MSVFAHVWRLLRREIVDSSLALDLSLLLFPLLLPPLSPPALPSSSSPTSAACSTAGSLSTMSARQDLHYHEDHLRRLLDQRTARADLHGRFPSVSDFSDSPSVYSHAHFSPRPVDRDLELSSGSYHHFAVHERRPSVPQSPGITDRQRLNIPDASSLDLDDDSQPSYTPEPSTSHDDDEGIAADGTGDDDAEVHRVSAYGPKMTVHSRAPWEMGEDDVVDLNDADGSYKKSGFKFTRKENPKKSRQRDGRHQCETRPSLDSLRSQSRLKQSFETVSSQVSSGGALLYVTLRNGCILSLTYASVPLVRLLRHLCLRRPYL